MELPEVRQCTDPKSNQFGSVAVRADLPFGEWFVGNPGIVSINTAGGHWGSSGEVEGWTVLDEAEDQPPSQDEEEPAMPVPPEQPTE